MLVRGAESLDPVLDIAGFSCEIFGAVAIVDVIRASMLAHAQKALLLGDPNRWIGRIAQHKPVKPCTKSGVLKRLVHRAETRHYEIRIFIVRRQEHCRPARYRWNGRVGSIPSASRDLSSSTAKPANADMNENATHAKSNTKRNSTIHSSSVTP